MSFDLPDLGLSSDNLYICMLHYCIFPCFGYFNIIFHKSYIIFVQHLLYSYHSSIYVFSIQTVSFGVTINRAWNFNKSYRFDINIYIGSIFVFYIRAVCLRAHHKQGVGPWGRLVRLKILSAILSTNTTRCFLDIWWKSYLFSIVANLIWRDHIF